jgi:hypothetical protein
LNSLLATDCCNVLNRVEVVALRNDCDHETSSVPPAAPRIDARLVAALTRLDDPSRSIADAHRRLGLVADWLGVPRPSYEQVRVLVNAYRRRTLQPGVGVTLLEIAMRAKPPEALLDVLSGTASPERRNAGPT